MPIPVTVGLAETAPIAQWAGNKKPTMLPRWVFIFQNLKLG
jgi:hypothetical protein